MAIAKLLKLTGAQLAEKGIRSSAELGNYIKVRPDNNKLAVSVPGKKRNEGGRVVNLDSDATLQDAINLRNSVIDKAGFSKKEKNLLLQPPVPGENVLNLIKKQRAVDKAAEKFNKNKPETWKGLLSSYGEKDPSFVLPTDKNIRKFVIDKLKESSKATSNVFDPSFNPSLTNRAMIKQFSTTNMHKSLYNQSLKKLGIQTKTESKSKSLKGASAQKMQKLKDFLFSKAYTAGQKKHLREVNEMKKILNKRSGIYYGKRGDQDKALEIEHAQAVYDVARQLGINNIDEFIKKATPEEIRNITDVAMRYSNLQFATKLQNRGRLSKSELFETGTTGEHSKKGIVLRNLEVERLRATGKYDEADVLEQSIKNDVNEFIELRKIEAKTGLPLNFDYSNNHWLPEYAQIKSSDYYNVPARSISQQIFDIAKARGITLPKRKRKTALGVYLNPGEFKPITETEFLELKKDGGSVGVQPITDFDTKLEQMMNLTGFDIGDSVIEIMKDNAAAGTRENFKIGGIVGDPRDAPGTQSMLDYTNKVGAIEGLLAGIGAGLLDIPKGAFTLGASLMDLGVGTNNAAKVENWFDSLNDWDDKAEQHWLGSFSRIAVNLGVPGAYGWKAGEKLARRALLNKRNGNYFKLSDPELPGKFQEALNAKGRLLATLGAAGGAGVTDAIFVGDPEGVGTFGDMIGMGPTELDPNDANEASKEIVNRMKFGLDGSLMIGLVGGTGSAIKSLIKRRNDLSANNDKLDKFFGAFRPRGQKSQLYFDIERRNIGARAGDINFAGEQARKLDKHIDAIFPFVLNPFKKMNNKGRAQFMQDLNDTLLSGDATMDSVGKVTFGDMDKGLISKVKKTMRERGAKKEDIDGVFDSFEQMRLGWGHIFSRLGYSMDGEVREAFSPLFAEKFKSYLGSTYEIFQNKGVIPFLNYKPTEEAVQKTIKMFMDSAEDAGKPITKNEAEVFVNRLLETARLPRDIATSSEKTSGIYFDAPDFFLNRTTLSEIESAKGTLALEDVVKDQRKIIEELFGKVEDPMQTMLTGTNRLSLIGRRNQFYNTLMSKDKEIALERTNFIKDNPGKIPPKSLNGLFRDTEREAITDFGRNIKKIEIDPSRTIEAGSTNPLHGKYAERGVAEAIEESAMVARDKSTLNQLYESFLLYPKATSQLAKTVLSPVTHARNFISAGAFASANGLIPGVTVSLTDSATAFKEAFEALQIPGARMANERYRDLLRLGVVNSNVRLGDLQRLLKDTNFGESINSRKALREMFRPLSKFKKATEDFYTAEDDFWKITSFALERQRLGKAYEKYGIARTADDLDEEAASIVRDNIPNYDMVNDFIRATRRLPLGNFVSFPAEIYRTTGNIISRAIKEIKYEHVLDDGRIVNPLRTIGLKRAFGMGTTVLAVPYGTVEAFKVLHDVTEEEIAAMRRFVPDWSKNSTLIPLRDEDGQLKYVDFSHANAYDTMIRPLTALYTGIQRGATEGEMGREVLKSMYEGTSEALSPFVSESIWTTALADIVMRQGRTREGNRLYTDETPLGEQFSRALSHVIKTQFPGSIPQFQRLDRAFEPVDIITRGKFDKYGQDFEIGNELQGFLGFRAVEVDPVRAMKFKIADFRTGINNARREFTSPLLRGGPVTPEQIVDRYKVASDALYKVQSKMFEDYYAARTLGTPISQLDAEFADRVSDTQLTAIKRGEFKPFVPSENIEKAFAENARGIGEPNPYARAKGLLRRLIKLYDGLPLGAALIDTPNPFRTSGISQLPILQSQALQGLTNSPVSTGSITATPPTPQNQLALQGQRVFGTNDTIFGTG